MYLGNDRRNKVVALGLAAALIAVAILTLVATVASSAPATPVGTTAAASAGASSTTAGSPPAGHHGDELPASTDGTSAHPGRLVGLLVGVGLLLTCGVMVVHEQRRRAADGRSSGRIS